ncbi:uncharacterized protein LOC108707562 isoform X2 [Xenopus laevis]|uniref:Uncharacterized protein LOC108707562 isoform X2 n=1 Tax=Xenopus laevis TaxID=8355 RepID=A0A8J0UFH1_XENLA|nr:uncharacterized protein LOC108707562 isoform X2 [Xenopus laevis]
MSTSKPVLGPCAFCHQLEQNPDTGLLLTNEDGITAHFNCMIFSPEVISAPTKKFGGFDIPSVKKEIKRGIKTICRVCRKNGATIGCNVKQCRKTYHYMCGKKDGAEFIESEEKQVYLIYCKKHKHDKQNKDGDSSSSVTSLDSITSSSIEDSDVSYKPKERKKRNQKQSEGVTPRKKRKAKRIDLNEGRQGEDSAESSEPGPSSRYSDTSNIEQRLKKQKQKDLEETTPRKKTTAKKISNLIKISNALNSLDVAPINENQNANEVCITSHSSEGLQPMQEASHDMSLDRSASNSESSESLLSPKIIRSVSLFERKKKTTEMQALEVNLEEDINSEEQRILSQMYILHGGSFSSQDSSLNVASQHINSLNVGDIPTEHIDIPVSTNSTFAKDSEKLYKPVGNSLAEVPVCSTNAEKTSISQSENHSNPESLANPYHTNSPTVKSTSGAHHSADEKHTRLVQPMSSSNGDEQSNKQCIVSSQNEGASQLVVQSCLKDLPAVALEQSIPRTEPSLNILGMNSSSAEQPVFIAGKHNSSIKLVMKTPIVNLKSVEQNEGASQLVVQSCLKDLPAVALEQSIPGVNTQSAEPSFNILGKNSSSAEQQGKQNLSIKLIMKTPILNVKSAEQNEGASQLAVKSCLKDLPAVALEQSISGVNTQSAEPSLNILGMNSSSDEQPVLIAGEDSSSVKLVMKTTIVNVKSKEHSISFFGTNKRSEEQSKCLPKVNNTSAEDALYCLVLKSIKVPQTADIFPPVTQCSNTAVAQSTSSPRTKDTPVAQCKNSPHVHGPLAAECPSSPSGPSTSSALATSESVLCDTENQDWPIAHKVALFSEYTCIKHEMTKGDLGEGDAKDFWTKCQSHHCRQFLLENIEKSVKSVSQKILSGEAEDQDYETALRYLWGSGCLESVIIQEKQEIQRKLQSLEETKERLQKNDKALTDLLGKGK